MNLESPKDLPRPSHVDLVQNLLSFDSQDLELEEGNADVFLIEKACELNQWVLQGSEPRFFIQNWVEVLTLGSEQLSYRILNARAHQHAPLTLNDIIAAIKQALKQVDAYQTDLEKFLKELYMAYDILCKSPGEAVPLKDIYEWIYHRHPRYKREQFGLDLNRLVESNYSHHKNFVYNLESSEDASKDYFYVYDEDQMRVTMKALKFIEQ